MLFILLILTLTNLIFAKPELNIFLCNGKRCVTGVGDISLNITKNIIEINIDGIEILKKVDEDIKVNKGNEADVYIYIGKGKEDLKAYGTINLIGNGFEIILKPLPYGLEEIYVFEPGFDISKFRVQIKEIEKLSISKDGELEIYKGNKRIVYTKPVAYQFIKGKRRFVEVDYLVEDNFYGFKVGEYDRSRTLYIDPVVKTKYYGGKGNESAISLAVGKNGDIYAVGFTTSGNFLKEAFATGDRSWDVYIARFDENLKRLKSLAIISGSKEEWGRSVAIDDEGYVYIGGWTHSEDLPVTDSSFKREDADIFIAKFDPKLEKLLHLGYLGGNGYEYAYVIKYHGGNIYIAGETSSIDFPITKDAYDTVYNGGIIDTFIMKLDKDLNIIASTYLGGKEGDAPLSMFINEEGVYVAGLTWSPDLPVSEGAFDTTYNGGYDGYIAVFDKSLKTLRYLTYIGGKNHDNVSFVYVDGEYVIVGGKTFSADFPVTENVLKPVMFREPDSDGFVSILTKDLKVLKRSTYLGGSEGDEVSRGLVFDDYIVVAGATSSEDFPFGRLVNDIGKAEGFVAFLDKNLRNVEYSVQVGGSYYDIVSDIVFHNDKFYVSGWTVYIDEEIREEDKMQAFLSMVDFNEYISLKKNLLLAVLIFSLWAVPGFFVYYYYRK